MRSEEKLAIARMMIDTVAPEVRLRGWHQPAHPLRRPSMWSFERDGFTLIYAENVLLYPDDDDTSCLLDVWPIGHRKVFSVSWKPSKPWVPPCVSVCKSGCWLKSVGVIGL